MSVNKPGDETTAACPHGTEYLTDDGLCLHCQEAEAMQHDQAVATSGRWEVKLYQGGFVVDAESEHEARAEALQAVAESLDLFVVRELPTEESLPTVDEVQGILRDV